MHSSPLNGLWDFAVLEWRREIGIRRCLVRRRRHQARPGRGEDAELGGRRIEGAIMKTLLSAMLVAGLFAGCSPRSAKSPDVVDRIRHSLDQARLTDVTVSQDRDKGVVTLGGHVAADRDKGQAGSIAESFATGQVVANQIEVHPPGLERDAKRIVSDLDKGIGLNLDAALIQNGLHDDVKYSVATGVVTLTGEVNSQRKREYAEKVAASVPNVQQVVNELQVKDQKATSR
jgi:osmotically-inducible protein OsmY